MYAGVDTAYKNPGYAGVDDMVNNQMYATVGEEPSPSSLMESDKKKEVSHKHVFVDCCINCIVGQ